MNKLLAGFGVLLALSGCGDKNNQAADTHKAVEANKKQEQPQTESKKEDNDAILARHMKCRQEKGTDCFKILEEMHPMDQQQARKKEHNDAVMARHMKCRQEKGTDCFKILEDMQK